MPPAGFPPFIDTTFNDVNEDISLGILVKELKSKTNSFKVFLDAGRTQLRYVEASSSEIFEWLRTSCVSPRESNGRLLEDFKERPTWKGNLLTLLMRNWFKLGRAGKAGGWLILFELTIEIVIKALKSTKKFHSMLPKSKNCIVSVVALFLEALKPRRSI